MLRIFNAKKLQKERKGRKELQRREGVTRLAIIELVM